MNFSFFNEKKFLEVEFYSSKQSRTFRLLLKDKISKKEYDKLKNELESMPFYFLIRFTDEILWNSQMMSSFDKLKLKIKKYALEKDEHEIDKFKKLLRQHKIKYFTVDERIKLFYRDPKSKIEFVFNFHGDSKGWNVISSYIKNNELSDNLAVRNLSNSARPAHKMFDFFNEAIRTLEPSLELSCEDELKSYKILF